MMKTLKSFLQVVVIICMSFVAITVSNAQSVIEVSGMISQDTVWQSDTVKVVGDITVPGNITLTINPGTYIKVQGYYGFEISGSFDAKGAPGDTIIFAVHDSTGFSDFEDSLGSWKGIVMHTGLGRKVNISYCSFSGINSAFREQYTSGGIYIRADDTVKIKNSVFQNIYGNGYGGAIQFWDYSFDKSFIEIDSCSFLNNTAESYGGALYINNERCLVKNSRFIGNWAESRGGAVLAVWSNSVFENNTFRANGDMDTRLRGGAINIWRGKAEIIKNSIYDNKAGHNGGGIFVDDNADVRIVSNMIFNNEAELGGGIYLEGSEAEIKNSLISNNLSENGGGIYADNSNHGLLNNTIVFNRAIQNGGGLYLAESEVRIDNSILSDNVSDLSVGNQVLIDDNFSSPDIFQSLVYGGTGDFGLGPGVSYQGEYQDNIDELPMFISVPSGAGLQVDAASADFSLQIVSPCINAGNSSLVEDNLPSTDLAGQDRLIHGYIDQGAYETHISSVFAGGVISVDTLWVADTVFVTDNVTIEDGATLRIAPGTLVSFLGHYCLDVKGVLLARGLPSDSIRFTVNDSTGFHLEDTSGSWDGIYFDNSSSGANGSMNDNNRSVLNCCIIENAKTIGSGGGLYIHHFSNLEVINSTFENNRVANDGYTQIFGGGMYLKNADICIQNCRFINNSAFGWARGGAIFAEESNVELILSYFENNYAQSSGSALGLNKCDVYIDRCDYYRQYSTGIEWALILTHSEGWIRNSRFANNQGALLVIEGSNIDIVNSIFVNNCEGWRSIMFSDIPDQVNIANCTFANNDNSTSGSVGFSGDAKASIFNSIFHNNGSEGIDQIQDGGSHSTGIQNITIRNTIVTGGLSQHMLSRGSFNVDETLMDTVPVFIRPSGNRGPESDGLEADWSLSSLSPAINMGVMSLDTSLISELDLNSNTRINDGVIDLGAYENQDAPVEFTKHPVAGSKCAGDQLHISVQISDTAIISWLKDGIEIQGADQPDLVIDSVTTKDQGNYMCLARNSYGSVSSNSTTLFVNEPPEVVQEQGDIWAQGGKSVIMKNYIIGSAPSYQWQKDGVDIAGEVPELIISDLDYTDEGDYRCIVSNVCGRDTTTPARLYLAPQICMVTVSQTTGHNLVVWEKESIAPVMAYNIYRESVAAGIYDRLATITYDDLSVFVDTTADPTVQAYLYKITAIDSADYETDIDLCNPHKTIHLIVSTNPELNTTQLQWDRYYGFEYSTYTIYRSSTGTNFDPVHSLSASLNSWTDPNPSTGDLYYRIAVEKPDPCVPSGGSKKAGTGPYVNSLSNMDDNKLKVGENPPESIVLDNREIDENLLPGSLVGRLTTIDVDTLDYYTYHLVSGSGDDDNGSFSIIGDLLVSAATFDYETKNSYLVRIRTTDNAAFFLEKEFVITINDTEEGGSTTGSIPPDSIILDLNSIPENNLFGDPIGTLATADKDAGDVHTYRLVSGSGSDDNLKFMITGDVLRAAFIFDYEQKNHYSIRVSSSDLAGNQIERIFIISITDVVETGGLNHSGRGSVRVFPNPFSQSTTIKFPNPEQEDYTLVLTDLSGKTCRIIKEIISPEYILTRGDLDPGIYFIELSGSRIYRAKIILE